MYLSLIALPLLGSIVSGFFGRKVGVSGAQLITITCVIVTTFIAFVLFLEAGLNGSPVLISTFKWIDSESFDILWAFNFDSLTVSMLIPVLIVSSLVHIYSVSYMDHDPHNQRFFSYLSLFTFMMVVLITSNNFLIMFVGWEGVGICSYLLVNFWFTRIAANQSSISAFLTNRVGDCFLTIAMFAILLTFGNLDYYTVFSLSSFISQNSITLIGICLLIGAMAKSSQIGLHVWLPLAMEGPTPVSALIHAATMVTAGVYLLMRASPLIEYSSTLLLLSLWLGSITTVFSSLIGLFQQDIKKVIAYSTMSQLGMMVIAVGLSSYGLALFHLVNHAFYKGLLFLGAGAVIHAVSDNQDFRKYGGLRNFLPLTYTVMLIASLSLVAFPFMTGFFSKDFILESAFGKFQYTSVTVYSIATIGAMFTTLYSVKVLYLTFLTSANGPVTSYNKAHEGNAFMVLPLIILALFSIFFGYITKDLFIGLGSEFFADNAIFIHPSHEIALNTEYAVPTMFKLLPLMLTVILTIFSLILFEMIPKSLIYVKTTRFGYNTFSFLNLRFLIEYLYNRHITAIILKLGGQTTKVLDKGSVEILGPYGLEKGLVSLSNTLSKLDTGVVTSYSLYILIGLISYMLAPYVYLKDASVLLLVVSAILMYAIQAGKPITTYKLTHYDVTKNSIVIEGDMVSLLCQMFLGLLVCVSYSGSIGYNSQIKKALEDLSKDNPLDKFFVENNFISSDYKFNGFPGSDLASRPDSQGFDAMAGNIINLILQPLAPIFDFITPIFNFIVPTYKSVCPPIELFPIYRSPFPPLWKKPDFLEDWFNDFNHFINPSNKPAEYYHIKYIEEYAEYVKERSNQGPVPDWNEELMRAKAKIFGDYINSDAAASNWIESTIEWLQLHPLFVAVLIFVPLWHYTKESIFTCDTTVQAGRIVEMHIPGHPLDGYPLAYCYSELDILNDNVAGGVIKHDQHHVFWITKEDPSEHLWYGIQYMHAEGIKTKVIMQYSLDNVQEFIRFEYWTLQDLLGHMPLIMKFIMSTPLWIQ